MTAIRRHAERSQDERTALDAILDASPTATLSTVRDGQPLVVPVMAGRDGDRLIVHGSTGAGALRAAAAGSTIVLSVMLVDGLVYADSLFDSSANYRSAVVSGVARTLSGQDAIRAVDALCDHLMPGRRGELRRHLAKEMAATLVLELAIGADNWTAKARSGPPGTEPVSGVWQGELPIESRYGPPRPHPGQATLPVSPSVAERVGGALA